ncbi:hypothetical protein BCV72DRAFT_201568 [Rhizopus microsporus var. microsporus]|uniref:Uncharacterized protein n=1 Tax=Rhizopus microsporus var. microsporus TaxID=86635 RepID=A0A1X0RBX9_RHIZD|nr:hypothetical protein BCV72DRAFT_201568 [Rhizopus microsporus var. microsporus]
MITDYPKCTYHGCDIADFTFNIGNVAKVLSSLDNSFGCVYMRLFILTFRPDEWPIAVKEPLRVTKPGVL